MTDTPKDGQDEKAHISDLPWRNCGPSLAATQEHILMAMRDLNDHATDTVWLTDHETVFDRLMSIYQHAGGDPLKLADAFPEYFAKT